MRHRATPDFWYHYRQLPAEIQDLAVGKASPWENRGYGILKENPRYPSLHFKKVWQSWSVRVALGLNDWQDSNSGNGGI
jgi:hypothetical protein